MRHQTLGAATVVSAILAFGVAPLLAQQAAAQKIGFVNVQSILQQAPGFAQAESTYKVEFEGYKNEVTRMQASMDSAASEFEQASVLLSPSARAAKRKDLQAQQDKLDQRTAELREKATTRERELLDPIQSKVNSIIETVRAEGNYAMIFDVSAQGSGILTADKALDLTEKVIKRLLASK